MTTEEQPLATQIKPEVREDIQAPYKFTPEEQAQMNIQLRHTLNEIDTLTDQKKASAQDFSLRITNKGNEAKQLRNKLDSGEETRPVKAIVEFDVPRSRKRFIHPETKEFIREELMTPADWQLPMFKPAPNGQEKPAAPGEQDVPQAGATAEPAKAKRGRKPAAPPVDPGATNVGYVIDQATADDPPSFKLVMDLTKDYAKEGDLIKDFKAAAKSAEWKETQIALIFQLLKNAKDIDAMIDVLRPHTTKPVPAETEMDPLG